MRSVPAESLRSGNIYFVVSYLDESLLVPVVETLVFLGRDILREGGNRLFFQDAESYYADGPFEGPGGRLPVCDVAG